MIAPSKIHELNSIAKAIVAPGKGLLAADESTGTIGKRFEKIALENTEANRRAYRELLVTAPGLGSHISGVILYDETIRQSAEDARTFVSVLKEANVLPGIKVDEGTSPMQGSPDEKVTKGLDGLPQRLKEYFALGAKFAKWRAVITMSEGLPTTANIIQNAKDLAQYALNCQEAGIVPILEPEVLMDWKNDMARCAQVTEAVLIAVFEEVDKAGVALEGMLLKTNMVLPGKQSGQTVPPERIAEETVRLFQKVLPKRLPGQVFLSGGQTEVEATTNLNAMHRLGPFPWTLSFSYGRALQDSCLKTWNGKSENIAAAQAKLVHRATMNGFATLGKYNPSLET